MNKLLDAALQYANMGIPVLPLHSPADGECSCPAGAGCPSPAKHPRTAEGLITAGVHDATTDVSTVTRWWETWPDANIGVRTGTVIDVCDVDTPDGLNRILSLAKGQPLGPVAATGAGGWHLWYQSTGRNNRVGVLPGVDWRGGQGYAVAPPSLHQSGRRYMWLRPLHTPLPKVPAPLMSLLEPPKRIIATEPVAVRHLGSYVSSAIDAEVARVLAAPSPYINRRGDHIPGARNDTLNVAAFNLGQLVGAALVDQHTIERRLLVAAQQAGLGFQESVRTIRSGLSAGRRNPRERK